MSNIVPMQKNEMRVYNGSQLDLIRNTVAKGTTADEFNMFVEVCKNMQLDPFRRQIYCIVYSPDNPKFRKCVFITGIDGFRSIAARSGSYRPDEEEPVFVYDKELKCNTNPLGLVSASVRGFKQDNKGDWHPLKAVAYWDEFAPIKDEWKGGKPTGEKKLDGNWPKMGRIMLSKCAESQMIRKGWPEDVGGVYVKEEMDAMQSENSATEEIDEFKKQERMKRIEGSEAVAFVWAAGDALEFVPIGKIADKCMEFISTAESATGIETWMKVNAESLKRFWAVNPNDALEVKKALENKIKSLTE